MQDIDDKDVGGRAVSVELRAQLAATGKVTGWDNAKRPVKPGYGPSEVKQYCVDDPAWQKVRLSLKGLDTTDKLHILEMYWDRMMELAMTDEGREREIEVQVGNYLGALRRGGQLNDENQIRKAR